MVIKRRKPAPHPSRSSKRATGIRTQHRTKPDPVSIRCFVPASTRAVAAIRSFAHLKRNDSGRQLSDDRAPVSSIGQRHTGAVSTVVYRQHPKYPALPHTHSNHLDMKEENISPFFMVQHKDSWSLLLSMDEKAESLFSVDPEELDLAEDFEHGGYHWEALAKCFLQKGKVTLTEEVDFDSESSMFCMFSTSESALLQFAQAFKAACADPQCLKELLQDFGEYLDD